MLEITTERIENDSISHFVSGYYALSNIPYTLKLNSPKSNSSLFSGLSSGRLEKPIYYLFSLCYSIHIKNVISVFFHTIKPSYSSFYCSEFGATSFSVVSNEKGGN